VYPVYDYHEDGSPGNRVDINTIREWIRQLQYGSLGYMNMCRFYSSTVYTWPSLRQYDYYLRHDTDSYYTFPVQLDPFKMAKTFHCEYVYEAVGNDIPEVTRDLYETTSGYWKSLNLHVNESRAKRFVLDNGVYNRRMFWTHFELSAFRPFRTAEYRRFSNFLDQSRGFYKYRW
jgi:hypothetical protein